MDVEQKRAEYNGILANLCFFCYRDFLSIKFIMLNRRFNNRIDDSTWKIYLINNSSARISVNWLVCNGLYRQENSRSEIFNSLKHLGNKSFCLLLLLLLRMTLGESKYVLESNRLISFIHLWVYFADFKIVCSFFNKLKLL